ncbi:MAG: hypothetical protein E6772_13715 [Dysgonomonas sp.]|nr:hypothetical protein [Dysgonomonas sp.]
MKYLFLLFIYIIASCPSAISQTLEIDSIFRIVDSKFSASEAEKIKTDYYNADEQTKAMMLNILSMPMSSKKELIENYESKQKEIAELKNTFENMVPKGYVVFVELKNSDRIPGMVQAIDFQVYKKNAAGELDFIDGDWDLDYGDNELDRLLTIINWDRMTLLGLKNILQTANCISIQNGEHTEIGFARSGLGKYFYILFPKKLNKDQIEIYNDGCEYLYYKNNVVLKYVGGMAGPQCFTD